jgi:peptidoglycan/xylan/chitin deacetylase (PgdA/CDA1 family)
MRRASELALGLLLGLAGVAWGAECAGMVYLTLDTGNMGQAEEIARILTEEGVRATFFVANERTTRGDRALEAPWASYWKARVAEGHAFGNHTWSHHYARRDEGDRLAAVTVEGKPLQLDREGFCAELRRPDEAFFALTGRRLGGMWRAPGGRTTQQSVRWAAGCGFPVHVGWNDAGALGDDLSSDRFPNTALLRRALEAIRPGDVLMMHLGVWDRREPFSAVLRALIQGLKARRLCFAPLEATAR